MSPLVGATGGAESREGVPAWFAAAGRADFVTRDAGRDRVATAVGR